MDAHALPGLPLATVRRQSPESGKKKLGGEPRNIRILFKHQENGLIEDMSVAMFLSTSAIVWLVRILGSHPSDPGSSPGGGNYVHQCTSGKSLSMCHAENA